VDPLTLGGQSPLGFGELLRRLPVTFGKDRLPGAFFPRPVRIVTKNPNTPYFVTSTIVAWIPVFTHKDHLEILASSLGKRPQSHLFLGTRTKGFQALADSVHEGLRIPEAVIPRPNGWLPCQPTKKRQIL
jgi:hypothetical protein